MPHTEKSGRKMEIEVLRGEEEWQRAGAYSVRIEGMNRQHHISLREEFDEHDGEGTRYIILLDSGYPIATCRFYELDRETVMIGRVVVLPEYRGKELAGDGRGGTVDQRTGISGDGNRKQSHRSGILREMRVSKNG